jgi:bis(5'-nucleosidyl)-tetraphosphatase
MPTERHVSAGIIVFHREEQGCRFLLLLSRLTKRPLWEFPKGGVDPGETVLEAALRELREETGLGGEHVRLLEGFQEREVYRFTVDEGRSRRLVRKTVTYFLAEAAHMNVTIAAKEASRYQWFELQEAVRRVRYRERRRILLAAADVAGCPLPESVSGS